jgi:hypothetical protein
MTCVSLGLVVVVFDTSRRAGSMERTNGRHRTSRSAQQAASAPSAAHSIAGWDIVLRPVDDLRLLTCGGGRSQQLESLTL